jgi:hypothetical protein
MNREPIDGRRMPIPPTFQCGVAVRRKVIVNSLALGQGSSRPRIETTPLAETQLPAPTRTQLEQDKQEKRGELQ